MSRANRRQLGGIAPLGPRHAALHADRQLLMLPNPHHHRYGGRRRSLAGPRADAPSDTPATQTPPAWRAPEGPGRLRERPLRAKIACGALAGGRARRRPEHQRRYKQQRAARTARGRAATHGHTKQPGPTAHQRCPEHPRHPEHPQRRKQRAHACANPAPRMRDGVSPTQSGGRV